ncbi:MAG: hypothetical protein SWO11_13390 [Thermodesulfobacteriota bacterium]|nr:hypothetical protein [Thermodesulfobacteriota bacterium]
MRNNKLSTEADQRDASAYDAHYAAKDIPKAFALYEHIIAAHPDRSPYSGRGRPFRPLEIKTQQRFLHERDDCL